MLESSEHGRPGIKRYCMVTEEYCFSIYLIQGIVKSEAFQY